MKMISRRDFLKASAVVGAAGVLTACGDTAASTAGSAAGSAAGPGMYRCLPGVSVLTPPPDFALAAAGNLTWAQGKIALDVPLLQ